VSSSALTQNEIDRLIQGIRSGEIPTERGSLAPLLHVRPLDVGDPVWSQDRIVRRRLHVLDLIYERLGPLVQVTLTKNLRFPVRTETEPVVLQKFGDFRAQSAREACLFENVRLDPLRGASIVLFEPVLIYALIDALMGGLGVGEVPAQRDLSEIEVCLLYKLRSELLRDFENSWKPWFPIQVEHLRSDRNVHVVSAIAEEEVCHIGKVVVSGDVLPRSPIYFVHPYSSLEPLFEATSERSGEDIDPSWRLYLEQNLRSVQVELSALLGSAEVPAARLAALAPGDVLELDAQSGTDIDVCAESEPILKGRIGQSRLQYAVQVTELLVIQREVTDRTAGQALVRKGLITREQLQVARVDERLNRRSILDSIVARGWAERRSLERALESGT
jgi:flagellar motor switch protein FliM